MRPGANKEKEHEGSEEGARMPLERGVEGQRGLPERMLGPPPVGQQPPLSRAGPQPTVGAPGTYPPQQLHPSGGHQAHPPRARRSHPFSGRSDEYYYVRVPVRPLTAEIGHEEISRVATYYGIYGGLFTLIGIMAIILVGFLQFHVSTVLAWSFILSGVAAVVSFFLLLGAPGATSFILLGALHLSAGTWMILQPKMGVIGLVFVTAAWFLAHGILKFVQTCQIRHVTTWPAVLVSGLASVILALIALVIFPAAAITVLGVLVGADLISTGLASLFISFMACLAKFVESEGPTEPLLSSGRGEAPPASYV